VEVATENFVAHTRASIYDSEALYACFTLFICLLAYVMGLSTPSCTWDKTAATASLEVSVVRMKGSSKFG